MLAVAFAAASPDARGSQDKPSATGAGRGRSAEPENEARAQQPKLPPNLEQVYGIAMATPPEFAASAMVRLSHRVTDKPLRRELLDMAFHLAATAQNPVRLVSVPGSNVDTRGGSRSGALRLGMDALSLQSQAVRAMVAVDPRRARELFGEMRRPSTSPAGCEASLLPDVSAYYDALAAVTSGGFTDKERARADHVSFANAFLAGASSVADLAPVGRLLGSLDWPREYFEIALGTFTSKLEAMSPDSQAFLYFAHSIDGAVGELVAHARQLGSNPGGLVDAYRKFLVTQLRAPRCAGADATSGQFVQGFDTQSLFGPAIRGERPALTADEKTPEQVSGTMELNRYWQTTTAKKIYEDCLRLRRAPDGQPYTEAARRSSEWLRQFDDYLSLLASWRSNDEPSEADYYHQKATVYEALLELAPPGDANDHLIESFVGFLKGANLQQENAVEWFWHARETVNRVRPEHPERAAKIEAAFRSSGNIILMLESMLDEAAPLNPFILTDLQ